MMTDSATPTMLDWHFDMRNLNVLDKYKGMAVEDIKYDLNKRRSGLVIAFENVLGDFNASTGLRCLNAFCGESFILIGRRKFDSRGAVGTNHYENMIHSPTLDILDWYRDQGYRIVAAENNVDYKPIKLPSYNWEYKTVLAFGEEGRGISRELLNMVDEVVEIPQRGSVRSLNVGTASGIMAYDYHLKMGLL